MLRSAKWMEFKMVAFKGDGRRVAKSQQVRLFKSASWRLSRIITAMTVCFLEAKQINPTVQVL